MPETRATSEGVGDNAPRATADIGDLLSMGEGMNPQSSGVPSVATKLYNQCSDARITTGMGCTMKYSDRKQNIRSAIIHSARSFAHEWADRLSPPALAVLLKLGESDRVLIPVDLLADPVLAPAQATGIDDGRTADEVVDELVDAGLAERWFVDPDTPSIEATGHTVMRSSLMAAGTRVQMDESLEEAFRWLPVQSKIRGRHDVRGRGGKYLRPESDMMRSIDLETVTCGLVEHVIDHRSQKSPLNLLIEAEGSSSSSSRLGAWSPAKSLQGGDMIWPVGGLTSIVPSDNSAKVRGAAHINFGEMRPRVRDLAPDAGGEFVQDRWPYIDSPVCRNAGGHAPQNEAAGRCPACGDHPAPDATCLVCRRSDQDHRLTPAHRKALALSIARDLQNIARDAVPTCTTPKPNAPVRRRSRVIAPGDGPDATVRGGRPAKPSDQGRARESVREMLVATVGA